MKKLKRIYRCSKRWFRYSQMRIKQESIFLLPKKLSPRLFNLDLHASVIEDLRMEFNNFNVKLTNWSISGSNRFKRRIFTEPDPVQIINDKSWQSLSQNMISDFLDIYRKRLMRFDGFVVTHTPSFAQIYEDLGKPILVVASTRYEAPFTNDPIKWKKLNKSLTSGVESGCVFLTANNAGDGDYLNYFTGLDIKVTPSICDYTNYTWRKNDGIKLVMSHSKELINDVILQDVEKLHSYREYLGSNYKWNNFDSVSEILCIPYNISTMTLFEFATAGVPVAVPSPGFLKQLVHRYDGVLSELSYFQILKLSVESIDMDNPNNFQSDGFLDWWIDRSDFYNSELMPNVRLIDSFEEFVYSESAYSKDRFNYSRLLQERNVKYKSQRSNMVKDFISKL